MNEDVGRRFMLLHRNFHALQLQKIKVNVTQSEYYILMGIVKLAEQSQGTEVDGGGVSMNALAKDLMVTPPMVTKTVTGLEKKGLVKRLNNADDRRGVKVCLTHEGYDKLMEDKNMRHELLERVFDRFSNKKTQQLLDLAEELMEITKCEIDLLEKEQIKKG